MAKLSPLSDRVVAKQVQAQAKTASGFYLPEDAQEKPDLAVVESVGKDVIEVKKGDTIVYKTYNTPVKVEGVEYLILKEEEILAIVETGKK